MTMPRSRSPRLDEVDPRTGQALVIDHAEWTIVGHATYRTEGYHADEWECRKGGTTGYLLKERERDGVRWFFTIPAALSAVTLPGGESLDRWRGREPQGGPPATLVFRGGAYRYETSTEGLYEEQPGRAAERGRSGAERGRSGVGKTTWEYWDGAHVYNLAIEQWPDGRLEAYHGAYVDPRTLEVRSGSRSALAAAVIVAAFAYFIALLVGLPFDRCTGISLLVVTIIGLVRALYHAPSAAPAGLILTPLLGIVFFRFPPLTTVAGLVTLIAAPALMGRWALTTPTAPRSSVRLAACFTVALPLLVVGLYYYFSFAPGPRSFGQYALAIGPAVIGGLAAMTIAGLVLRASE